ncbi:MAG TPA: 4Fe-4S single cluster domain-containing protein [Pirellulales bacterium]
MTNPVLNIAQTVACTEAEGPGRRFALWFQGCPLRCPGCCNPEMLPFSGGVARSLDDVLAEIDSVAANDSIEGVTFLGGEPTAHAGSADLARVLQHRGLSVMVFSGYTLPELRTSPNPWVGELLAHTDILVDGPYLKDQPDRTRRWIGSTNQGIHFLTSRYAADDPRWAEKKTLEIRLEEGKLSVNGFPARSALGLWKRPKNVPRGNS